jgi:hypothetical protein
VDELSEDEAEAEAEAGVEAGVEAEAAEPGALRGIEPWVGPGTERGRGPLRDGAHVGAQDRFMNVLHNFGMSKKEECVLV